jgi:putative oxidoreductase
MCAFIKLCGPLMGRILLSAIFIIAGIHKANTFESAVAYLASQGLMMTEILLVLIIIIELVGGLLILVGWQARWAAMVIFIYLIPLTLFFHPYWNFEGQELMHHFHSFFKNIAIMGGMMYIMVHGSGPLSLDNKLKEV